MSNSIHLISLLLLASGLSIHAQEKRAMTFDEMVGWERISEQRISDNGKWVFCKMEPWRGDATILLYNDKGEEKGSFKPAAKAQFSSSSEYLLVTKTPPLKEVEAEKLKKTDKDKIADHEALNCLDSVCDSVAVIAGWIDGVLSL